ncbi:MAG: hypothetical protein JST21_18710, partial [Bacteroidetes bacterium]|nr:hypothetical protein [Bacteroidota bacterium]
MDYLRTYITTTSNAYLQSISMEEGRIRPATRWSYDIMYYDYFEKDHLGNVRV